MVTVPGWTYKGHIVNDISDMPKNTYGFIYETKHIPSGQKYLGKKVLFFERNKRLGKRALQALKEERAKKGLKGRVPLKQKVITESDWKDYYGSHKDILKLVDEEDSLFWTGFVYKDKKYWPVEKPSWTAAAVILAANSIFKINSNANFF